MTKRQRHSLIWKTFTIIKCSTFNCVPKTNFQLNTHEKGKKRKRSLSTNTNITNKKKNIENKTNLNKKQNEYCTLFLLFFSRFQKFNITIQHNFGKHKYNIQSTNKSNCFLFFFFLLGNSINYFNQIKSNHTYIT